MGIPSITKRQLNMVIDHTPSDLDGKEATMTCTMGRFSHAETNWSYIVGWGHVRGEEEEIFFAMRFGHIVAHKV